MSAATSALPTRAPLRVPVGGLLTPRMERLIRLGSVGSALVIAISAMVLSYAGLHDLALDAQVHPRLALLVPIMVDGLQFVGSLGVVYSTLSGLRSWYPWLLMLSGVSISAWGNWQAAPDDLTAKLLHSAAPVILALVLEELLRVMRHKVHVHTAAWETAQTAAFEADSDVEGEAFGAFDPAQPTSDSNSQPEVEGDGAAVEPVSAPAAVPVPQTVTPTEAVPVTPTEAVPVTPERVAPAATVIPGVPAALVPTEALASDGDEDTLPFYPEAGTFKEQIKAILTADPDIRPARIAKVMGKDPSYTRKMVRDARTELDTEATAPSAPATVAPVPAAEQAPAPELAPVEDDLGDADPFEVSAPAYAAR